MTGCQYSVYHGGIKKVKSYISASSGQNVAFSLEQGTGVEPAFSAWEADALPMY